MEGGVLRYRNPPLHLRSRLDEVLKRAGDSRAGENENTQEEGLTSGRRTSS